MEINKFEISKEEVSKLCKNVILLENSDYYQFLKVTKFVEKEYDQFLVENGHNEYVLANASRSRSALPGLRSATTSAPPICVLASFGQGGSRENS